MSSLLESFSLIPTLKGEPRYRLAQNVATSTDFLDGSLDRDVLQNTLQVFQHAVPAEGKPVTNQKNSGKPLSASTEPLWWEEDSVPYAFKGV
uniref:Uncharacterized protein n=1 Tax=Pseudonaja textilis TaxID=8673 RepID=A0A670ZS00_PSETE